MTDALTTLSFSAMSVEELAEHHREMVIAQREVNHWHRLITARIDLAVASVADLEEPVPLPNAAGYGTGCAPPPGLRDLLGIARLDDRLGETTMLMPLRRALAELEDYGQILDGVTEEAAQTLAFRVVAVV
jgi:hypothetical protein